MTSLAFFNYRFTPSLFAIFLTSVFFLLLLRLGFWQLHRAAEKESMLAFYSQFAHKKPFAWHEGVDFPKQYEPFKLQGNFLPEILLLDNQHYQHQLGYEVINLFLLKSNEIVLVDRGWIPASTSRSILPKINIPSGHLHIKGCAYYPAAKGFVLGLPYEKKDQLVTIIEQINPKLISQILHKSVYPFIMRLDKNEQDGFVREWPIVAMTPEKHKAYALQWFAMAAVVLILFLVCNLKKCDNE